MAIDCTKKRVGMRVYRIEQRTERNIEAFIIRARTIVIVSGVACETEDWDEYATRG